MKAAVFHALKQPLTIERVNDPTPAPDELVIEVGRCGICGSDLHMTEEPMFGVPNGAILGHEFAGEIVALGARAEGFKVGDRVAVAPLRGCGVCPPCRAGEVAWCERTMLLQGGGYGEYATATPRQCLKLPQSTSVEDGALVEPLAVALHGVTRADMEPGARVLVLGAGPIGLGAAFWARRRGASKVVVADLFDTQRERALAMGATDFVTVESDAVARVHAAMGGAPEIVFECAGKPGIVSAALEYLKPRGTIVMLGLCTQPDSFVPFAAVQKEAKLVTSAFFTMGEYQAALDMLDGGHAPPKAMITDTVALAAMPAAFEALRRRSHQCKVMVQPGG